MSQSLTWAGRRGRALASRRPVAHRKQPPACCEGTAGAPRPASAPPSSARASQRGAYSGGPHRPGSESPEGAISGYSLHLHEHSRFSAFAWPAGPRAWAPWDTHMGSASFRTGPALSGRTSDPGRPGSTRPRSSASGCTSPASTGALQASCAALRDHPFSSPVFKTKKRFPRFWSCGGEAACRAGHHGGPRTVPRATCGDRAGVHARPGDGR